MSKELNSYFGKEEFLRGKIEGLSESMDYRPSELPTLIKHYKHKYNAVREQIRTLKGTI